MRSIIDNITNYNNKQLETFIEEALIDGFSEQKLWIKISQGEFSEPEKLFLINYLKKLSDKGNTNHKIYAFLGGLYHDNQSLLGSDNAIKYLNRVAQSNSYAMNIIGINYCFG